VLLIPAKTLLPSIKSRFSDNEDYAAPFKTDKDVVFRAILRGPYHAILQSYQSFVLELTP